MLDPTSSYPTTSTTPLSFDIEGSSQSSSSMGVPKNDVFFDSGDLASASVSIPVMQPVSGNITQGNVPVTTIKRPVEDTLDEPVSVTIYSNFLGFYSFGSGLAVGNMNKQLRDLRNIWAKLQQVLFPRGNKDILRDWDLWGPLLLCLALSIRLSITAPENQSGNVFTGIFVIVWCGAGIVTLNSKLLGGKLSFFQSVCVLGYCIFPLVIASMVSLFIPSVVVRACVCSAAFAWSTYGMQMLFLPL
ncbi:Yip1 member 6 [Quaeritorhiza haematococci]|nr:Yip1 member 6 [Quaeritorhiza haematococci]